MRKLGLLVICLLYLHPLFAQDQKASLVIPIGHTGGVSSVDISPDGKFLITGSFDQTVKIWDWNEMEIRTLVGHQKNVLTVAFSPKTQMDPEGGQYILSGGSDRSAILWDRNGNQIAKYFEEKQDVISVAFSPNAEELLVAFRNGLILILDFQCKERRRFQLPGSELFAAVYSPDGKYIAAAGSQKTIVIWKSTGGMPMHTLAGHAQTVNSLSFSADGKYIASGSNDGTAILWKATGSKEKTFKHGSEVLSVALSPDAQTLLTGGMDGNMIVWTVNSELFEKFRCSKRELSTLRFARDGRFIICASKTEPITQIRQLNGKIFKVLQGYTSAVKALALSPDGKSLLIAHADSTAKIWNMSNMAIRNLDYPDELETV
ncbi:MAG: WD40 repeat domain-containing protein, partial [Saprospiraceae bacterium]|nr:WD40 repeat domain-containing protein [Saprospiraceae bacterium]